MVEIINLERENQIVKGIVAILVRQNPGYDFGINPKDLSLMLKKEGIDTTALRVGHILKFLGFREKFRPSSKIYRRIYIDRLMELQKEIYKKGYIEY